MSEEKGQQNTVEIVDQPAAKEEKIIISDEVKSGLSEGELEMLKESGLESTEGEEGSDDKGKKKEEEGTSDDDKVNFEAIEKDEKLLKNFNKNEQGLYWRWKHDKKERQSAQSERDHALIKEKAVRQALDKANEDGTLSKGKLEKIEKLLTGPEDGITIEAIQEILKAQAEKKTDDKNKPLTKADLEEMSKEQQEKQQQFQAQENFKNQRLTDLESYGKENYENVDDIIEAAKEVFDGKAELPKVVDYKDLATKFVKNVHDKNMSVDELAEFVLGVAKLNPNYGKKKEGSQGNEKEGKKFTGKEIDRVIKNAGKGASSASVTSGGASRRVVSYDDLTLDDASKLTTEQWAKVPKEVKQRLLN